MKINIVDDNGALLFEGPSTTWKALQEGVVVRISIDAHTNPPPGVRVLQIRDSETYMEALPWDASPAASREWVFEPEFWAGDLPYSASFTLRASAVSHAWKEFDEQSKEEEDY